MIWGIRNFGVLWQLTQQHIVLSAIPTVVALVIALALGLLLREHPTGRKVVTVTASVLFTIPSLALFIVIPSVLGTQFLDPINVIAALTLYSTSLMVRTVFDSLEAVPTAVRDAADAIGYSPMRRTLTVDLPLAIPVLAAGTRVIAVTNVSLVSVGALIGVGGLGQLFTAGYQRSYPDQVMAGIIATLLLAVIFDRALAFVGRVLTPWSRVDSRRAKRKASASGRAGVMESGPHRASVGEPSHVD